MNPLSPLNPLGSVRPPPPTPRAAGSPAESARPGDEVTIGPEPEGGSRRRRERPQLVHPGTPEEYRRQLEPLLARLPLGLVHGIAEQGYTLHVLGAHPLTLEPEPPGGSAAERTWTSLRSVREIAEETGAGVAELLERNPHLPRLADSPGDTPVAPGEPLLVPERRAFGSTPVNAAAWEFLTQPRRSFMAGLVTHGRIPGFLHAENRILLWDLVFRDPLRDWYVLHELGHTTDFAFAFRSPDRWREWRARLQEAHSADRCPFTRYAGESPTEYFAEGFAAWATPHAGEPRAAAGDLARQRLGLDRETLRRKAPELYDLIVEAVELSSPDPDVG